MAIYDNFCMEKIDITKFSKYNEYLEQVLKRKRNAKVDSLFFRSIEDTAAVIIDYFNKTEKITLNEKDSSIYENNLEITNLFSGIEEGRLSYDQHGGKIITLLNTLVAAPQKFCEISDWANGIRSELLRVTGINILEFGLLSEFLSFEHENNYDDIHLVEDWGLINDLKENKNNFDIISRATELNRAINVLKIKLEREKKKKKKWF